MKDDHAPPTNWRMNAMVARSVGIASIAFGFILGIHGLDEQGAQWLQTALGLLVTGMLAQGYVQNPASTVAYREAILSGALATARGRELTSDDRLRRAIIERLMCDLEVDVAKVAAAHGRSLDDFAPEFANLARFAQHGLLAISAGTISIAEHARPFVRNVCAVFDVYLTADATRFSRAL